LTHRFFLSDPRNCVHFFGGRALCSGTLPPPPTPLRQTTHTKSSVGEFSITIPSDVLPLSRARLRPNPCRACSPPHFGIIPQTRQSPTPTPFKPHFLQFLAVVLVSVLVWTVIRPNSRRHDPSRLKKRISPKPLILLRLLNERRWYARRGSNSQPSAPEADALSN
jgi:hypothetical protein